MFDEDGSDGDDDTRRSRRGMTEDIDNVVQTLCTDGCSQSVVSFLNSLGSLGCKIDIMALMALMPGDGVALPSGVCIPTSDIPDCGK